MRREDLIRIWLVSFIFAGIVGSGVYGFGNDYYAAYYRSNLQWGGLSDQLGYMLATLTYRGLHFGVYLTSFLLSGSVGILLYKLADIYRIRKDLFLFISYIVIIHTWPVIMSTSNAMRQGIMMSFIFFAISFYLSGAWKQFVLFTILAFLSHKSSMLYVGLLLIVYFVDLLSGYKTVRPRAHSTYVILAVLVIIGAVMTLPYILGDYDETRIISGDFRAALFLINMTFIVYFFLLGRNHLDTTTRYLFLFSAVAPVFLYSGLNWQYERINMVLLIPYIVIFSRVFVAKYRGAYLLLVSSSLLALTFYTGMYASFS